MHVNKTIFKVLTEGFYSEEPSINPGKSEKV